MAELAEMQRTEFELAKTLLEEAVTSLTLQFAKSSINDAESLLALECEVAATSTYIEQLEKLRPVKKNAPYNYVDAFKPLCHARASVARARLLFKKADSSSGQEESPSQPPTVMAARRNIPEVQITKFNGDVTMYNSFITAFKLKFDALPIQNREKLQHLKENLTGNPLRAIRTLDLVDANYDTALDMLERQYNRPEDVVDALFNRLDSMPQSSHQTDDIDATYHEIEGILAALQAHGHPLDSFAPLRKKIYTKYPEWLINTLCAKALLPVAEFQEGVRNIIATRTSLRVGRTKSHVYKSGEDKRHTKKSTDSTAAATPGASKNTDAKRTPPPCIFCSETHYSNECTKYRTVDERTALVKDRCSLCFRKGHKIETCVKKSTCFHCKKQNAHHQALCPSRTEPGKEEKAPQAPKATSEEEKKLVAFTKSHRGSHTTTIVTLINPETKKSARVRALFDNGASESYILEETARKMNLSLAKFRTFPISTFGEPIRTRSATTTYQITNENGFTLNIVGETIPQIPQDVNLFSYDEFRRTFPNYAETELQDQGRTQKIEILIGADYYFDLLKPERKITVHEGLYIFATPFGNMLVGRTDVDSPPTRRNAYFAMTPTQAINKITALETIGIRDIPVNATQEEEIALSQFYENIKFIGNRYQIRWPWREIPPPLENNFALAVAVLRSQQRKLSSEMFAAYNQVIQTQLDSNIVEEFEPANPYAKNVYYLPHHAVINLEKTTPLRIVFNGAAKSSGARFAINEVIYKGINLLSNSLGILVRTLLRRILAIGDIEKAFHQLLIDPRDADYVRFLWLKDQSKPASGSNLRFLRFLRVAFGIDASPFLLYATIRYHLEQQRTISNSKWIDVLLRTLYADNVTAGFDNNADAMEFHTFSVNIFALCSMNLRSWASNSPELREKFTQPNSSPSISVLGVIWNQFTDELKLASVQQHDERTLRTVLSTVSSLYDPCGWTTPIITTAKLFLRTLHDSGYDWDDVLSVPHQEEWEELEQSIIAATNIRFPRYQFSNNQPDATYELHAFSDGSEKAYASVVYLRKVTNQAVEVTLLLAKARIVPRAPKLTIPKIELIAAVLASQHIEFLRQELTEKIDKTYHWIDAKAVLAWITKNKILPVYIQRRVNTIRAVTDVEYRYVASEKNPADLPSRGGDASTLTEFRTGPKWLVDEISWPAQPEYDILENKELADDLKLEESSTLVATTARPTPPSPFKIDAGAFSSYLRLLRVTSYAMRFISRFKRSQDRNIFGDSSLNAAERIWIGYEQLKHYFDALNAAEQRKQHELIRKLNLYVDARGILRCAGRFQHAPLSPNEKRPILLAQPKNSHFTRLIIEYYHRLTFHAGTTRTLHAIRRKFWIPAGRRAVYNIVRACNQCKRFTSRPLGQPTKSDLPELRLEEATAFSNVGIDTFGPFYVSGIKYFVLIVTDLVIRALDLELLGSMSSEEIMLALRRIFARHRTPEIVVSDNAPQFHVIATEMKQTLIADFEWKFLPAHSPWMGGAYERLIGLVKSALSRTFYNEKLSESAMRTALAEIAASLNERPLTYVSEELDDQPITPAHFLHVPFVENSPEEMPDHHQVRSYLKHAKEIREKFYNAWKSHYLQYLRNQHVRYNFPKKVTTYVPRVGDIVLLSVKLKKRHHWPMGKIVNLHRSDDGIVRSASIQTKNGIVIRPLMEVFPLELHTNVEPPPDIPLADDWEDFEVEETIVEGD